MNPGKLSKHVLVIQTHASRATQDKLAVFTSTKRGMLQLTVHMILYTEDIIEST